MDRRTWLDEADAAAARKWGEEHSTLFAWKHGAGLLGLALGLGAIGAGAYWLWHHVHVPHVSAPEVHSGGGIPVAFWIVAVLALVGSAALLRSTFAPAAFFVKLVVVALVWLGLAAFGFAYALT